MARSLPERPSLEHLRKQAKDILQAHKAGNASACAGLRRLHRFADASDEQILAADFSLKDVQFALAMDYGFKSWAELKNHVRSLSDAIPERKDYSAVSLRGNGHSDDSFSLSFAAAANVLGRDAQYDKVLPLSTNPFAPAFYLPEGCPSFWHQRGRDHGLDILRSTRSVTAKGSGLSTLRSVRQFFAIPFSEGASCSSRMPGLRRKGEDLCPGSGLAWQKKPGPMARSWA
jgi:hypothetical protein